jgi:hypothetical protein
MKISKDAFKVLSNFSTINNSLWQDAGNVIKAVSPNKNLFATAQVSDTFNTEFGIYDLSTFLGLTSLFNDPDFDFSEKSVTIKDESSSARYMYADKQAIKSAWTEKELVMPQIDVYIDISSKDLDEALKAAKIMDLPNISFEGKNGDVTMVVSDSGNDSSHIWRRKIGQSDKTFNMIYRTDLFKFIPGDYKVGISSKKITTFIGSPVTYYMAANKESTFSV